MQPSGQRSADDSGYPPPKPGGRVLVLTGNTRAGKTTTCRRLAAAAAARGWRVAGVVCPARFRDGAKVGIDATDLRSGESRLLAVPRHSLDPQALALRESGRAGCRHAERGERGVLGYLFDEEVLGWANGAIAAAAPCDLLIVDEVGPLEIEQGRGFVAAFDVLRRGEYRLAVVVVRPSLLDSFGARLGIPFDQRLIEGVHYPSADSDGEIPPWFEEYLRG